MVRTVWDAALWLLFYIFCDIYPLEAGILSYVFLPQSFELWLLLCCCRSQSVVEPGVLKRPDKVKSDEDNMQPLLSLDWNSQLKAFTNQYFQHTQTHRLTCQTQQANTFLRHSPELKAKPGMRGARPEADRAADGVIYSLFIYLATCQVPILGSVTERLEMINTEQGGLLKIKQSCFYDKLWRCHTWRCFLQVYSLS